MRIVSVWLAAPLLIFTISCANTKLISSAKSPNYTGGPVQKVAVLMVDERQMVREVIENHVRNAIAESGQPVTVTHSMMSLNQIRESESAAVGIARDAGADAVLIIRLVDQKSRSSLVRETNARYVPSVTGFGTYYGWYDYFTLAYTDMSVVRGNLQETLSLETSLYDLVSRKLLWIGLTEATWKEQTDRVDSAQTFIKGVVSGLRADGLIR